MSESLVEIRRYHFPHLADLAKMCLEAEGFDVHMQDGIMGNYYPIGVGLFVPENQARAADELLKELEAEQPESNP